MDIMTFRAYKYKMLAGKPKLVQDVVNRRLQLTLDLLGREAMSVEGLAIIISHAMDEHTKDNR